jgi:hypothetical protein
LPAVAKVVKHQRVKVKTMVMSISEIQPHRHLILGYGVPEQTHKQVLRDRDVKERNRKVEVSMVPGLSSQESVNSPAAIDPDRTARTLQQTDNRYCIL